MFDSAIAVVVAGAFLLVKNLSTPQTTTTDVNITDFVVVPMILLAIVDIVKLLLSSIEENEFFNERKHQFDNGSCISKTMMMTKKRRRRGRGRQSGTPYH